MRTGSSRAQSTQNTPGEHCTSGQRDGTAGQPWLEGGAVRGRGEDEAEVGHHCGEPRGCFAV